MRPYFIVVFLVAISTFSIQAQDAELVVQVSVSGAVKYFEIAPDQNTFIVITDKNECSIWNLKNRVLLRTIPNVKLATYASPTKLLSVRTENKYDEIDENDLSTGKIIKTHTLIGQDVIINYLYKYKDVLLINDFDLANMQQLYKVLSADMKPLRSIKQPTITKPEGQSTSKMNVSCIRDKYFASFNYPTNEITVMDLYANKVVFNAVLDRVALNIETTDLCMSIDFNPTDGMFALAFSSGVVYSTINVNEPLKKLVFRVTASTIHAIGNHKLMGDNNYIYDTQSGIETYLPEFRADITSSTFDKNKILIASQVMGSSKDDTRLFVFNTQTLKVESEISSKASDVNFLKIADNSTILIGSGKNRPISSIKSIDIERVKSNSITNIDLERELSLSSFMSINWKLLTLATSPDGKLALVNIKLDLLLINTETGKIINNYKNVKTNISPLY